MQKSNSIKKNLGFTLLLAGAAFASPIALNIINHSPETYAPDVLNLFSFASWLGFAHFYFAYQGHFKAASKLKIQKHYYSGLIISMILLSISYILLNTMLFSFLAWVYFIYHFLKTEKIFSGSKNNDSIVINFTVSCFGIFTYALFGYQYFLPEYHVYIIYGLIALLLLYFLPKGLFSKDNSYFGNYVILGFFFLGEAFLWGSYNPYMTSFFRQGIYTFHIACASFYHYFQSYNFDLNSKKSRGIQIQSRMLEFITVNLIIICLGIVASYVIPHSHSYLNPPAYFTYFVALHLIASDMFNYIKSNKLKSSVN